MESKINVVHSKQPLLERKKANAFVQKLRTAWFMVLLVSRMIVGGIRLFFKILMTKNKSNIGKGGEPL